ncbi:hypothetical protein C2E23DRAFT_294488 [Lenzites betulinus]|nr:hypothetical protein C2E23DRAFT_294488 [Lenzites betulinus]
MKRRTCLCMVSDHGNREDLRHRIFKDGDDAGASAKISWLQDQTEFTIKNHGPLTYLLAELKSLVAGQVPIDGLDNSRPTYITYEMFLDAFDTALDMPGWPTDDHARAYKPVSQVDQLDAPTSNAAQPPRPVLRHGPVKTEGQPPRPNKTDLLPHPGREHRPVPRTLDNPELFVNTPEKRGGPFAAEAPFEIPPFGGNRGPRKRLRTASGVSGQEECGTESRPRKRLRASKTRATAVPPTAKSRRRVKQPPRQGTRVSARQKEIQARKRAQGGAA